MWKAAHGRAWRACLAKAQQGAAMHRPAKDGRLGKQRVDPNKAQFVRCGK
jgi:hypothetical protein